MITALALARGSALAALAALPFAAVLGGVSPASAAPACTLSAERTMAPMCGVGSTVTLTPATARIGPNGTVAYDVHYNGTDVTDSATFTITDGSCTGAVCTASDLGDHVVTASYAGYTPTATLSVDRLVVTPTWTSVQAGQSVPYSVTEVAGDGTTVADLSSVATVTMDGTTCLARVCTPTTTGTKTITATYGSLFGGGALDVTPGPAARLALSPGTTVENSPGPVSYTAVIVDAYGNTVADGTLQSSFDISPDGGCYQNLCSPGAPGEHTVTATADGLTGAASLTFTALPTVVNAPLPGATVGRPYSQQLTATPGFPAATTSVIGGALPLGLTLSSSGLLSGTPTTAGSWTFQLLTGNAAGSFATSYTVTVAPAAPVAAPTVSVASASTTEGNSGRHAARLTVTLSHASPKTVTVHWTTSNGTAKAGADYVAARGVLTFKPGQVTASISVTVIGDRIREADDTVKVTLRQPLAATLGTASALLIIVNDD